MNLADLGYDTWFREKHESSEKRDFSVARISRVDRDRYLVMNESGEILAEPTGKLLFAAESNEDVPCVGDWVLVQYHNDGELAIVHEILPRRSLLRRKSPGKNIDYQLIASNIDTAFIMQSCDFDFNIRRLERYLVMMKEGSVTPIILLSKTDLVDEDDIHQLIDAVRNANADMTVIPFSNETGNGIEDVEKTFEKGKTYCMVGSSGVGKTTLLNHLISGGEFDTNPVREKDGRGRHTTSRRQLIILENGALLIDTPGLRELGMLGVENAISETFSDVDELTEKCRFSDCTHTREPGCAVLAAVEDGDLSEDRYESYLKLMRESAYYGRSYLEHRRRDKAFGKMQKAIMKHKKKGR